MKRGWIAVLVIAAVVGCKKKKSSSTAAVEKMDQFSRSMCQCKDKACADKVQDDFTKWGTEMAKNASSEDKPDPEMAKRTGEVMTKYTECMTKLVTEPTSPGGPRTWAVPPMPGHATADAMLMAARESATKQEASLVLSKLDARYVRSNGQLDPTYGALEVAFAPANPKDDPNRPIGAPVPEVTNKLTECPTWTAAKGAWTGTTNDCPASTLQPPRCNLSQVWKRALDDKVPEAALASMTLETGAPLSQTWTFAIVDKPRNIEIRKTYPDDCAPILEHP